MTVKLASVTEKQGFLMVLLLCHQVGIADGEMTAVRFWPLNIVDEQTDTGLALWETKGGADDRCTWMICRRAWRGASPARWCYPSAASPEFDQDAPAAFGSYKVGYTN